LAIAPPQIEAHEGRYRKRLDELKEACFAPPRVAKQGGALGPGPSNPTKEVPMPDQLQGKRIAILVANEGVEEIELTSPRDALREAGADIDLLAPEDDEIQAFNHLDKGDTFTPDKSVGEADPGRYDGLVLPGGVANPDQLRTHTDAVQFVRAFFEAGKPVGVICHGPWTLINADVVDGRTLTSWPSLQTDLRNAGAEWVDEEVHVDQGLVSSRKPDDLEAFNAKIVEEFAEGVHEGQRQATIR
jgi:protease I